MAELFGFSITKLKKQADPKQSFTTSQADDGTQTVAAGGHFGSYLDMEGTAKTEQDLIRRYREIAQHPECDMAIEDIVNEAIVANELKDAVRVIFNDLPYGRDIQRKIEDEFQEVLRLMNFNTKGHDIFRRWYVDGRVYYQKIIDRDNPKSGIVELKYIDPRKIKKIREVRKKRPDVPSPSAMNSIAVVDEYIEYFLYNDRGISGTTGTGGIKIAPDTVAFCASGQIDQNKNMVLSYLHKAIKPTNQLRMIEDAVVIYRIARAPERRIFKIDVGNLPKVKAEQYLRDVMARYRNKLVYDANTGEIRDDRNYMSMLEDFWLPSREGGRGTDITTLPGGQNLGEMTDVEYFRAKLYRSLNVPVGRLEASQGFNMGRASEITRDELKFTKFVQRLRKKFTELFNDIMRTQLVLKGIISEQDWHVVKDCIQYDFIQDGHFAELKNAELARERLALANEMRDYVGKFYSVQYIRKNVLKQSNREMEEMDRQIKKEIDDGIIQNPMAQIQNEEKK
jgi:hypothetical protein|tara:strand:+ start:4046 stop:5572 length:1527 start_codon:yes stop_codon:yes gene_type:complete